MGKKLVKNRVKAESTGFYIELLEYTPLTVIPYAETFGDDFVRGLVVDVKVGEKKVVLEDGETINFTHLVLATGSDGPFPSRGESGRILAVKEEYSRVAEQVSR